MKTAVELFLGALDAVLQVAPSACDGRRPARKVRAVLWLFSFRPLHLAIAVRVCGESGYVLLLCLLGQRLLSCF